MCLHTVSEIADPHNILWWLWDVVIGSAPPAGFASRVMRIEWSGRTKGGVGGRATGARCGLKGV